MATKTSKKSPMSAAHKEALARGRSEGKVVRTYLEALRATKPRRGRKRTPDSIKKRVAIIDQQLGSADPLTELKLIEERRQLNQELVGLSDKVEIGALEKEFIKVAKAYSARQGISYASWREVGVDARVLRDAGISRSD
jgi:DNA-binding transcriptional ArsR family regulator